jgi:hypothetical protein
MLDNNKQIKAFQILNVSGLITPDVVTYCMSSETEAKAIAELLKASIEDDIAYPESVTQYISEITRIAAVMQSAASAAVRLSDSITPFSSPSELLQMKLGWECHSKGNELDPAPSFSLVEGMQDKEVAVGLFDSLQVIEATPVSEAMGDINTSLAGGVVQIVPDEQVKALAEALAQLSDPVLAVESAAAEASILAAEIVTSTSTSKKALRDAVDITLTNNLVNDPLMSGAIAQIMPAGVISALTEEEK